MKGVRHPLYTGLGRLSEEGHDGADGLRSTPATLTRPATVCLSVRSTELSRARIAISPRGTPHKYGFLYLLCGANRHSSDGLTDRSPSLVQRIPFHRARRLYKDASQTRCLSESGTFYIKRIGARDRGRDDERERTRGLSHPRP